MVPVLENSQGQLICESAITCEYLDEAYPEKKLFPADPYEKARQKMTFELFSKVCLYVSRDCKPLLFGLEGGAYIAHTQCGAQGFLQVVPRPQVCK